ncbi:MAG: hypothetical protein V3U96_10735 [Paracoccaceae bacterium]
MATIQNLPADVLNYQQTDFADIRAVLVPLKISGPSEALRGLKGVFLDLKRMPNTHESSLFVSQVTETFQKLNIPILTKEQAAALPGNPRLSIQFSDNKDVAGCIVPFRATMKLTEEMVTVRDPSIKLDMSVWSASIGQNLGNTNFTGSMALESALSRFVEDFQEANSN